jgi:hypothetical protein
MMRLSEPKYSFETTLDECITGITGNNTLRDKLSASKFTLITEWNKYLRAGCSGKLHTIQSIMVVRSSVTIPFRWLNYTVTLNKSELINIYETYFVPEKKPARKIYDALLNAAQEQCPFCGGIGTPRNLDHFLPKTIFPQFSVLPHNLIPSCRDCNMDGKGSAFATNEEDQIIHPYTDKDIFFSEQWIFATYHQSNRTFEYSALPPDNWSDVDKARVRKHFKDFNLANRYRTKAAQQLNTVLLQINRMKQAGVDREVIKNVVLQSGVDAAPFANHWQKGMYQALINIQPS